MASTLGDNNDLGLRAVLPAASVLIAAAAAGLMLLPRRAVIAATAIGGLILSLPDTAAMIRSNVDGTPTPDGAVFAQTPELWSAVRRYAAPTARVANNPLFLQDLTPWPANISWALLANRSSCFAGRELALALAPLSDARREAINAQFVRVFAGEGTPGDISDMAKKIRLRCRRRRAAGQGLDQRPVRREPRLSLGGKSRWTMADLRGGQGRSRRAVGALQIPANQLKPCLLQNVSRKSLVTSIALIHLAFL